MLGKTFPQFYLSLGKSFSFDCAVTAANCGVIDDDGAFSILAKYCTAMSQTKSWIRCRHQKRRQHDHEQTSTSSKARTIANPLSYHSCVIKNRLFKRETDNRSDNNRLAVLLLPTLLRHRRHQQEQEDFPLPGIINTRVRKRSSSSSSSSSG